MGIASDDLSKKLKDIRELVFNNTIWIEAEESFYESSIIRGIRKIVNNNDYIGDHEKELAVYKKTQEFCRSKLEEKRSRLSCFFSGKKPERPQALKLLVNNILESDKIKRNEIMILASYRFMINITNQRICVRIVEAGKELYLENLFEEEMSCSKNDFMRDEKVGDNYISDFKMALDSEVFKNCIKKIGQARAPKRPLCL